MSRLTDASLVREGAAANDVRTEAAFKLRTKGRRLRPLHPEQVDAELRRKAASTSPATYAAPFGWLLRLYGEDGRRTFIDVPPGSSYESAVALRDRELRTGRYEKIWLERKTS